jgi:hypothetical protein
MDPSAMDLRFSSFIAPAMTIGVFPRVRTNRVKAPRKQLFAKCSRKPVSPLA